MRRSAHNQDKATETGKSLLSLARGGLGSLSFKLSFPVGLVILLAVALAAYHNIATQRSMLIEQVTSQSLGFADTLRRATFLSMLTAERGHLYSIIRHLADQPGIARVRIFNAEGRIMFSSQADEVGREVDKKAEACFGCHQQDAPLAKLPRKDRTRIFTSAAGHRMLGTIAPIHNQPSCQNAACHAHPPGQQVLGVLDVDMSLDELDRQLEAHLVRTLVFAVLLFLAVSTIIGLSVILVTKRAVRRLQAEVDKVAAGDEDQPVGPMRAPAELVGLARSIDRMARRVARRTELLNRRYRHLVDDSPEAILVLDQGGRLVLVNPMAAQVLERPARELLGRSLADLVVPEDRSDLLRALSVALDTAGVCHLLRLRFASRRGRPRILQGRFNRVPAADGSVHLQGSLMDITDRTSLEEQLLKQGALAAVGQTVSGLVPYINNLLHGMQSASYIVDQGLDSGDLDLLRQGWRMVGRSVARISSVAEDLLYYAEYTAEQAEVFNLNQMLGDVKRLSADKAGQLGVTVSVVENHNCQRVRLDLEGMRRAVLNLVLNALDALADGAADGREPRVILGCQRNPYGQVVITVSDNGGGIPPEVAERLFGGLLSTKGSQGTGMGLLICQRIIELHGGFIDFTSTPGRGTTFTCIVPDRDAGPPADSPAKP